MLQIPSAHVSDYKLYVYKGERLVEVPKNVGPRQREFRSRYPIHLFTASQPVFYLNVGKQPRGKVQIDIAQRSEFVHQEVASLMRNSLYYGLVIMSIVFNVLFYFVFREKRLVIYAALQISLLSIFFYMDGMFHYFSGGAWNPDYYLVWNIAICTTLASMFIYYFLDLNRIARFKSIGMWVTVALFTSVLIYSWTGSSFFRMLISMFCYLLPGICLYYAVRMFKENMYARFLVLTFGIFALVGLAYTINNYTEASFFSYFGVNTLRFASVAEILAISFVLIFKVRDLQEENDRYSTELREYLELLDMQTERDEDRSSMNPQHTDTPSLLEGIAAQYQLTGRESEVLSCLWQGDSNAEIAAKLHISVKTAKFHVSRLYSKLEVKNRSQARLLKEKLDLEVLNS